MGAPGPGSPRTGLGSWGRELALSAAEGSRFWRPGKARSVRALFRSLRAWVPHVSRFWRRGKPRTSAPPSLGKLTYHENGCPIACTERSRRVSTLRPGKTGPIPARSRNPARIWAAPATSCLCLFPRARARKQAQTPRIDTLPVSIRKPAGSESGPKPGTLLSPPAPKAKQPARRLAVSFHSQLPSSSSPSSAAPEWSPVPPRHPSSRSAQPPHGTNRSPAVHTATRGR